MPTIVTFLGTGTSHGVPNLGCTCPTCLSQDPRDKRLRPSITVQRGETTFLIDCGPDLRTQLLRENLCAVSAVLLTHMHGDHLLGIDDLQMLTYISRKPLPFYASKQALETIKNTFPYLDSCKYYTKAQTGEVELNWRVPQLEFHTWSDSLQPETVCGVSIQPVPLLHGKLQSLGYRFGKFAYLTDCSMVPEDSFELLHGLDTLIIDGLRPGRPHPTHFCFQQACDVISRIAPRQAFLTHLTHDVLHSREEKLLPPNVFLPYDGLKLTIED